MLKNNLEKITLGVAILIMAVFLVGGLLVEDRSDEALRETPASAIGLYEPEELPTIEMPVYTWRDFGPQRGETGWVFSLFTPPNVWFDPDEEQFFPFPPSLPQREIETVEPVGPVEVEIPFGVVLTDIEEVPFHIVLTGYIGEEGDFFVNLRNEETGRSFLSRPGREHPDDHEVRVDSFRRVRFEDDGIFRSYGEMTITNLRTGDQYVLRDGQRVGTGEYRAVFESEGDGSEFSLKPGEDVYEDGLIFTLEQIDLEEEEVIVQRLEEATQTTDVRTLRPNQNEVIVRLVEQETDEE
ncbi:MAG: hypothetical protein JJT75_11300 [Opitutales bacterium]|nr:hypothetical protein [Opitutales bacterium]MCH8540891.1 hypothetical protein [Opitutales bacterium]